MSLSDARVRQLAGVRCHRSDLPADLGTYIPTVTNSGGTAANFGAATAITFANGVATVSGSNNGVMRLYKVETANIIVSDGSGHSNGAGLSRSTADGRPTARATALTE